jgi:hypothetical protein
MDIASSPGYRFVKELVKGLVKATYYIPTFAAEQSLLTIQKGLLKMMETSNVCFTLDVSADSVLTVILQLRSFPQAIMKISP